MTWQPLVLGDSLEFLIDNRGKNPEFSEHGIPAISGMSVGNGVLDLSAARRVSPDVWKKWMPHKTRKHDVVLTSEAPLGRVALVDSDEPLTLAQRVFGLRGLAGVLDSRFLFYSFQTTQVQSDLQGRATGTTVLGIRQPALLKVQIPAPSYEEQCAIAVVLGALDDKIAANTKLAETIDDFLGVRFLHLQQEDDEFVRLGDIADVNSTTVRPTLGGQLRYIDIASVSVGSYEFPEARAWDEAPSRARRAVRRGDSLWSTVRPNRRSHALNLSSDPLLVGSTGLAVMTPRAVGWAYLYEVTRRPEFTAYLESVAEGSAYPAVRADKFEDAPVPLLSEESRQLFESLAEPLRESAHSLSEENRNLAATRDALLPQLMSGKLRVRDAESELAKAGV
ncbi:restriction endonuclease subunit S [Arthrobacter sp. UYEF20]|uniref:restriction endonuclease subunit S n=1 Tax=Arthrobacter sp. UYEF20 TaxID=1756363 RepID=UPI003397A127